MRNSSQNFVANDIQLLQSRPPAPILSGFTCGLIIFSLVFGMVLVRTATRLMTPLGRAEFVGYRAPRIVQCPECSGHIEQHRLISHLIVEHEIEPLDAGEIAGIVFSEIEMKWWCRGQDLNLRSTTHWDLIPAPLTTRVPLLELCRLVWPISQWRRRKNSLENRSIVLGRSLYSETSLDIL